MISKDPMAKPTDGSFVAARQVLQFMAMPIAKHRRHQLGLELDESDANDYFRVIQIGAGRPASNEHGSVQLPQRVFNGWRRSRWLTIDRYQDISVFTWYA